MSGIPRGEYPRPQFFRDKWLSLNGPWEFSFDVPTFDKTIIVPFAFESQLSGIGDTSFHPFLWYRKAFAVPKDMRGKRIVLHFGAVDYRCKVWFNNSLVAIHEGGQTPFEADVTEYLQEQDNVIVLWVEDPPTDLEIPRGKQYWEEKSGSIFYTRTSGIWQSVWIEAVSEQYLKNCRITPLFDSHTVRFEYELNTDDACVLETEVSFADRLVERVSLDCENRCGSFSIYIDTNRMKVWGFDECLTWSPENPRLFDVKYRVMQNGNLSDEVDSYFGFRKISVDDGVLMLNNRPYFQRLVLDQGYWETSLLTAPSDDAFIKDIQLTKAMGFNGVRKHQKVEDPRYLYYADRIGLLVWGECGAPYVFSQKSAERSRHEWEEIIERDYNHPCIVVWTPVNESWGVEAILNDAQQQAHVNALFHLIKSIDQTRLAIDNDGWEHTYGDLVTLHDYSSNADELYSHFDSLENVLKQTPGGRNLFAKGYIYKGQPILCTEYGGVKFVPTSTNLDAWGYAEEKSSQGFVERLGQLTNSLRKSSVVQGFALTQLTDVEQEQNGLLLYDRTPKAPLEEIRMAIRGY